MHPGVGLSRRIAGKKPPLSKTQRFLWFPAHRIWNLELLKLAQKAPGVAFMILAELTFKLIH